MHLPATGASRPCVLHVTQPVDGGVARVVTDLTEAQTAAGLRVVVACPDGDLTGRLRSLGADVRHWPATRSPGPALAAEVRRLARVVGEVRPDLVHAHSAKAGLAARLALRGRVPTVFQPHAWSFEAVGGVPAALARGWERWGARWSARTVCVSEAERLRGVRAGVRGRWAVVPNGIALDRFDADPPDGVPFPDAPAGKRLLDAPDGVRPPDTPDGVRPRDAPDGVRPRDAPDAVRPPDAPDGVPLPGSPLVVCVGRLCRQKGQDVLLAAWPSVLARVPGARLVLVGDGPDRARLAANATAYAVPGAVPDEVPPGSTVFAGAVADAGAWYRAADLVVLPSRWEGMALAPLEAMACARPVVVTDVDGAREALPPALVPHCLVPPENPAALARAVTALLLDPPLRAALGRRGRAHVRSTHDVRHTAAAVTALYDEVLTAVRPPGGPSPTTRTAPTPTAATAPPPPAPAQPRPRPGAPLGSPAGAVSFEYRESTHP